MKKLLFLTVPVVFAFNASAQPAKTVEQSVPNEMKQLSVSRQVEKEPAAISAVAVPSYYNQTMFTEPPVFKKTQKSGNYEWFGHIRSTLYADCMNQNTAFSFNNPNLVFLLMYPDSLTITQQYYWDAPDSSRNKANWASVGYVFDPYSYAYNTGRTQRLLAESNDQSMIYGYSIDTVTILGEYRIANYNPASKDTLRVFLSYYNPHNSDPLREKEYYTLYYKDFGKNSYTLAPVIKFSDRDDIPQKGTATMPVAGSTQVINYLLSPKDSAELPPGYIGYRGISFAVSDYLGHNFEVPTGRVASLVMQFIPGYDYGLNDTIRKTTYTYSTSKFDSDDLRQNTFSAVVIYDKDRGAFLDAGEGYNSCLAESQYIRYDADSNTLKHADWNKNKEQMYMSYGFIPCVYMGISVDEVSPSIVSPSIWDTGYINVNFYDVRNPLRASGKAPMTWSIEKNDTLRLPPGLNIDASTGKIYGTPTETGAFKFYANVQNKYGSDRKIFGIYISPKDPPIDYAVKESNTIVSKIYPNPATDRVRVELINDGAAELLITNILGQVMKTVALDKMDNTIDISSLNSGLYLLRVSQGGSVYTTKITKK